MPRAASLAMAASTALLLVASAAASLPSWYKCTCSGASPAPCLCPSTSPPGGLDPADTPQFVLLTHDDSITSKTAAAVHSIAGGKATADGCPVVATMFTSLDSNQCSLTSSLYSAGCEIADHTAHHLDLNGVGRSRVESEVIGARTGLAACGIPESAIKGFRQPFLSADPTVRQVLHASGFLYDSTLLECSSCSISRAPSARVWPYTLQDGVAQNCAWFAPSQTCASNESYPGMWEVPIWDLVAADASEFSMDYGDASHKPYDILKANFDAAYNGNRAPMPVYTHTPWLVDHVADMQKFVSYALSKPHVYFITMQQLLGWMQNPTPASKLTPAALGCGLAGGAAPAGSAANASVAPSPAPATASPASNGTASPIPAVTNTSAPAADIQLVMRPELSVPPAAVPSAAAQPPAGGTGTVQLSLSPDLVAFPAAVPMPAAVPPAVSAMRLILSPELLPSCEAALVASPPPPASGAARLGALGAVAAALACAMLALAF
ncbi:hypothetical protein ABPG75_010217 [Micractinium tetrahymenae]